MKILQVVSSLDPAGGGPALYIQQMSVALAELGHHIEVATVDSPGAPWLSQYNFRIHSLGPPISFYAYSRKFVPWLRKHREEFDAVIIHGLWRFSSFGAWLGLRHSQKLYFVYIHGMLDPWFRRTYPVKHLEKWLYWLFAEYRVLRDARAVLFTSEEERILARQSFWLYKCKETVVSLGITTAPPDAQAYRQRFFEKFPQLQNKRLFLFLGRIHFKKGCDLLIEAFSKIAKNARTLHLVMAGPDQCNWQAKLQLHAKQIGISERVTWTGMLSGDLKWGAFFSAEAFILPSHQENFGIAVVEALACGVPVLISDKVNIWRKIKSQGAGLVGEDNLVGVIGLLKRWIEMTDSERAVMRQQAKKCFLKNFEIHQSVQDLINTLRANGVAG